MKARLMFLAAALTGCAALANPTTERNGVLADGEGKTLYIFKKDKPGVSNCYDGCAKAWPPFTVANASKADGDFSVVARKDGTQPWAYKGQPLYFYAGDSAPGEASGEGSGGVWFVVKTKAATAAAPAKQSGGYSY